MLRMQGGWGFVGDVNSYTECILEMPNDSCNSSMQPQMWPQAKINLVSIPSESDSHVTQVHISKACGAGLQQCLDPSMKTWSLKMLFWRDNGYADHCTVVSVTGCPS